jgi:hypothetical protein
LGTGNKHLPLKERCEEALLFSEKAGADPEMNRKRDELQAAMVSLQSLIQETFLDDRSLISRPK